MKIKWFACAINDLSEIRKYIAEDNPTAAQNVASKIKEATSLLKEHSAAGRSGRIEGTREICTIKSPLEGRVTFYDKEGFVGVFFDHIHFKKRIYTIFKNDHA